MYLFIFSSHQHVQHVTSQILLILIDFNSVLGHVLKEEGDALASGPGMAGADFNPQNNIKISAAGA